MNDREMHVVVMRQGGIIARDRGASMKASYYNEEAIYTEYA